MLLRDKRKAIILGSGGAKGLAHLGVWKVLKEMGMDSVDFIAGTSMGAVIGAMMANNLNVLELIRVMRNMSQTDWLKIFSPHIPVSGFVSGKNVRKFLEKFLTVNQIEELQVPFGCAAYNYDLCDPEFLTSGGLLDALRASMSIPIIFDPYKIGDTYYLDGGLGNPLPIKDVEAIGIDKYLVVNVLQKPVKRDIDKALLKRLNILRRKHKEDEPKLFDIALRNISIIEWELARSQLELHKPKYLVTIDTSEFNILQYHSAKEIILQGENAALRERDMLEDFLKG